MLAVSRRYNIGDLPKRQREVSYVVITYDSFDTQLWVLVEVAMPPKVSLFSRSPPAGKVEGRGKGGGGSLLLSSLEKKEEIRVVWLKSSGSWHSVWDRGLNEPLIHSLN
jgi:hypothetical protein